MIEEHQRMYEEVKALLVAYAADSYARDTIAPLVALKSLEMNHLYEDLGMKSRTEMGKFMAMHFPDLAAKKPKEKLWKKYIYDVIGKIAPACATCNDQLTCFTCILKEQSA
ncbi:nitrogen fixation protein NifQ [Sulfurovum sp. zt1-1]|uniref:Nitrogen fixation protein NifQ n=1 Tax=Sulfurovum zhangzhouensis TaxID=3019067 RepID=A0ABT7QVD8_9BACT|nr:nitrogen fixation protein NifQ [Sulfurovum zhangzhouensis]MDM5270813.1 nitrogen fixation protein NifQ [Sulfurovum zhangzhouensis]